uniref:Peptidase S1 domain-containing protein n=1 Tax=Anopheles maculatus TaxID=74869 RepID=A0A182SSM5_9DIPT
MMHFFTVFIVIGFVVVSAIESDVKQFPTPISEDLTVDKRHLLKDGVNSPSIVDDSNRLGTNGYVAFPGQFPYNAVLYISFTSGSSQPGFSVSSGSLITPNYILTRAYELYTSINSNTTYGYAELGPDHGSEEESEQRVNFTESGMHVHPLYKGSLHDIATIRLDHPVTFNRFVQPIRLPRLSDSRTYEMME